MLPAKKETLLTELEVFVREAAAEGDASWGRIQTILRLLPKREYRDTEDVVSPACVVALEQGAVSSLCLVVPQGGGWITRTSFGPVQVVGPESPLGEALLGKKRGDSVTIALSSGKERSVRIADFY